MVDFSSIIALIGQQIKDKVTEKGKELLHGKDSARSGTVTSKPLFSTAIVPERALGAMMGITTLLDKVVKAPRLNTDTFKVERIRGDDVKKSLDRIHANIINSLNILNRNTSQTFDYVRDVVKQQDQRIENINKTSDQIKRSHD